MAILVIQDLEAYPVGLENLEKMDLKEILETLDQLVDMVQKEILDKEVLWDHLVSKDSLVILAEEAFLEGID